MNLIGFLNYTNAPAVLIDWVFEVQRETACPTGLHVVEALVTAQPRPWTPEIRAWVSTLNDQQGEDMVDTMNKLLVTLIEPYLDQVDITVITAIIN